MTDLIKVQFLRNGKPRGAAYTYKTPVPVGVGDKVKVSTGSEGIVVETGIKTEDIDFPIEKLKSIVGKVDEEEKGE